jgi:hypothetical protein
MSRIKHGSTEGNNPNNAEYGWALSGDISMMPACLSGAQLCLLSPQYVCTYH